MGSKKSKSKEVSSLYRYNTEEVNSEYIEPRKLNFSNSSSDLSIVNTKQIENRKDKKRITYLDEKNYKKAIDLTKENIEKCEKKLEKFEKKMKKNSEKREIEDKLANELLVLGEIYIKTEDYSEGINALRRSQSIFNKIPARNLEINVINVLLSDVYDKMQYTELAEQYRSNLINNY